MATLRTKAITTLQKLVRIKAANDNGLCQCVSCGTWHHWKDMDGGHWIPKGASSALALVEENIHPQCKGCNGFGMKYGSAAQNYTLWMVDYYGREFVDELEARKKEVRKIYKSDYQEMIKDWSEQIKEHEKRIA